MNKNGASDAAGQLAEKEIESMLCADAKQRCEYFIHHVCDTGKVWSLYKEGWATLGDGAKTFIPFWPHPEYAERFRTGAWLSYQTKEISLDTFIERWIPGMKKDNMGPAIFPVSEGSLATICLGDLEENLRFELKNACAEKR